MGWRIQITVQATTEKDFVYGLGNIGLVTHLEVWLGIIVACLPTLTPLFSKYVGPMVSKISGGSSGKRSGQRQLREAQNTIGGGSGGYSKKNYGRLDKDSLLDRELEEGKSFRKSEAVVGTHSVTSEEDDHWMHDPNAIGVRHDVQVYYQPQKQ